jgi:4-hydroxysphinganine ceramide fatty acyl 2-hydroxylase
MLVPTVTLAELESHNSRDSCYVSLGRKVYDVTPFLSDHPGGGDLILEHAGTDIRAILADEMSHAHTEAAYEILDDYMVGTLSEDEALLLTPATTGELNGLANGNGNGKVVYATGLSSEEDLSKETDFDADYKKHAFLDLNKPLLLQVWRGGFSKEFYLEQVHKPRHYKGGDSAPLFGNFLEPLSLTPWWVVPMVWVPPVSYGVYLANSGLSSPLFTGLYFTVGLGIWTIVEYVLHRFLFHLDG